MASVGFDAIDKLYPGGAEALSGVTLQVADGELLVVVGPSGCGKSTLLRLLAGLEQPTRGTLRIGDRVVNALSPQERNVAMVFQDYALYPHMSVRRNLEFPLRMRRVRGRELAARVERVAEMLGMQEWLDRLPRELSGGQRQRAAMGRALVREPAVFLMDEPLSNLDARLRIEVRDEIARLQRRTGTTMLYVTHDQTEAMTLGDRVAVLDAGRIQQVGSPSDLYERPASVFVAGFVGSPPMNLFPTRLLAEDARGPRIELAGHAVPAALAPDVLAALRDGGEGFAAGVRPEAVRIDDGADARGEPIPARVRSVERLGHEALVHLRLDAPGRPAVELTARLAGAQPPDRDAAVAVRVDPAAIHVFDREGRALGGRA